MCSSDLDSIRSYITSILGSLPYELTLKTNSLPFITADDSEIVKSLCAIIERTLGITPQLSTSGGTSDARFFASYGVNVVEIGVPNDRIHAINERVSISDILALHDIFVEFLQLFIKNAKIENLK